MTAIMKIEGIGPVYAEKLKAQGVLTVEAFLNQACSPAGRKALAVKTGIDSDLILRWANHADLFRVKGIGEEYSQLLEAAGVDTVPELAQRKAENLFKKMVELNEAKKLVRKLPVHPQVAGWIEQAKQLPRQIEY